MSEFDRMCIDSSNDLNEAGSPSSHPEATKARKRRHNMDPIEKRVYNAREADRKAVEYAVKKRKTSHGYLQASAETQSQLLDQTKAEIMNKRKLHKKDGDSLAIQLGLGDLGGAYMEHDDGNPAWVDDELDSEDERLMARNDRLNGEKVREVGNEVLEERDAKIQINELHRGFKTWQCSWKYALGTLEQKMLRLNKNPWRALNAMWIGNLSEGKTDLTLVTDPPYYKLPHEYFSEQEIAVWRNMMTWAPEVFVVGRMPSKDSFELPGPAWWWPDGYEPEAHGFWIPHPEEKRRYYRAWTLMSMTNDELLRSGVPMDWFARDEIEFKIVEL